MESEQSQNFNERLSQWVSSQGFWFQVRYSMSGGKADGSAMYHLLRISFRLLIFVLVAAIGYWVYLVKRTEGAGYKEGMQAALREVFSASDSDIRGISEERGQIAISRLFLEGDGNTFFSTFEARNVRAKKRLLDGVAVDWNPGTVSISSLNMELRAGADDSESAGLISKVFYRNVPGTTMNSFEVADATIRWGYSERTRGEISRSVMKLQRMENGMKIQFKGGTFSQNWLRNLEIVNLEITCNLEGVVFDKAEFRQGKGTVDLSGLKIRGGERPLISGVAKIRKLDLEKVIPPALGAFAQGAISGDFQVSGSTNTSEGVAFEGLVTIEDGDMITLRERIYLLKALSVVDYVRNYRRADFREGSFHLKTGGGGMVVSKLSLKAEDQLTLDGEMRVRLPTPEESSAVATKGTGGGTPLFDAEDAEDDLVGGRPTEDFTLRRAAEASGRDAKKGIGKESGMDRIAQAAEARRLEIEASNRLARTLRYEGMFRITLPGDAFERAERLAREFPVDPTTGRIPMMVPLEGSIYELTLKQAEDIYQKGTR